MTEKIVLPLTKRENKALEMCLDYAQDPFGAPNHLYLMLIATLYYVLETAGVIIEIVEEA